jgi:hypothetical protein
VGNEWIVLEGIHPQLPRLASRLPTVRPIATVMGIDPNEPARARTIQLRMDILRIDADTLRCSVIARGIVQLDDECVLPTVRVMGAVETEDARYAHLLIPPSELRAGSPSSIGSKSELDSEKTITFSALSISEEKLAAHSSVSSTLVPDIVSVRKSNVMPFATEPAPQRSTLPAIPMEGAPWSAEPVGTVPPLMASARSITMTLELSPIDVSPPAAIIPAPPEPEVERIEVPPSDIPPPPAQPVFEPIATPAAPAVVTTAPSKDIWAPSAPASIVAPVKPEPSRAPPKPSVKNALYGGGPPRKKS